MEATVGPLLCAPVFRPVYQVCRRRFSPRRIRRALKRARIQQPGWHSALNALAP